LIKERAAELGISGIGFCDSAPLDEVPASYAFATGSGYMPPDLIPRPSTLQRLAAPTSHLKSARSVISAYQAYYTGERAPDDPTLGTVAMYTQSNYYEDLEQRLLNLAESMKENFACRAKVLCCYVTLAEKPLARKAGVGFYGKHGVIVTPRHGSFVVLGEILTDLELEPDPRLETDCGACRSCLDACPVGALKTPYFVDRNLCIQAHCGRPTTIPMAVRDAWQNRFYGCTTCQDACPRNAGLPPLGAGVKCGYVGPWVALSDMLLISPADFEARFGGNQIGRRERNAIRRNAIVAAGNSRSEIFDGALALCAEDADPMIRRHALWAIWKLKGGGAHALLDRALRAEPEPTVREEIKTLLDGTAAAP
jgi:epoxyqueuosine reductase